MKDVIITKISENSILYEGNVFYTRKGYMSKLGLSENSIRTPYVHVSKGMAEHIKFFSISFFRAVK